MDDASGPKNKCVHINMLVAVPAPPPSSPDVTESDYHRRVLSERVEKARRRRMRSSHPYQPRVELVSDSIRVEHGRQGEPRVLSYSIKLPDVNFQATFGERSGPVEIMSGAEVAKTRARVTRLSLFQPTFWMHPDPDTLDELRSLADAETAAKFMADACCHGTGSTRANPLRHLALRCAVYLYCKESKTMDIMQQRWNELQELQMGMPTSSEDEGGE